LENICREDFVTCETAESEGVGCNKEYVVDGNNPVYMYEYNPNVMSSIVGFTKQYTECELRDWVYKDIEKNTCSCGNIGDNPDTSEIETEYVNDCTEDELVECQNLCQIKAIESDEINDGPIHEGGDGIADADNEGLLIENGCGCQFVQEVMECNEFVPAPMTWGWEGVSGEWGGSSSESIIPRKAITAPDGVGEYNFQIQAAGDSCLNPENFIAAVKTDDLFSIYFDGHLAVNDDIDDAIDKKKGISILPLPSFDAISGVVTAIGYENEIKSFLEVETVETSFFGLIEKMKISGINKDKTITVIINNDDLMGNDVSDASNPDVEKPQCAYGELFLQIPGRNIDLVSSPMENDCAVTIGDRLRYLCDCVSDKELSNCAVAQECVDDMNGFRFFKSDGLYSASVCNSLPRSCQVLIGGDTQGGYCDHNNKAQCLVNSDLSGSPDCSCGESAHSSSTIELCCNGVLVSSSDIPEDSPFACESRSNIKNTCISNNVNSVCLSSCPSGYNAISGGDSLCPKFDSKSGLVTGYDQCCLVIENRCLIGESCTGYEAAACESKKGTYFRSQVNCEANLNSENLQSCNGLNEYQECSGNGYMGQCVERGNILVCEEKLFDGQSCIEDSQCGEACVEGECVTGSCVTNTYRCDGLETLQYCEVNTWGSTTCTGYCDPHLFRCRDQFGSLEIRDENDPLYFLSNDQSDPLMVAGNEAAFIELKDKCVTDCISQDSVKDSFSRNRCENSCLVTMEDFLVESGIMDAKDTQIGTGSCYSYYTLHNNQDDTQGELMTDMTANEMTNRCAQDQLELAGMMYAAIKAGAMINKMNSRTTNVVQPEDFNQNELSRAKLKEIMGVETIEEKDIYEILRRATPEERLKYFEYTNLVDLSESKMKQLANFDGHGMSSSEYKYFLQQNLDSRSDRMIIDKLVTISDSKTLEVTKDFQVRNIKRIMGPGSNAIESDDVFDFLAKATPEQRELFFSKTKLSSRLTTEQFLEITTYDGNYYKEAFQGLLPKEFRTIPVDYLISPVGILW